MIPKQNKELTDVLIGEDVEVGRESSKTYKMVLESGDIKGYIDSIEAVKQAVYKILNTDRYKYPIYDWNYGIELTDLFGKPIPFIYSMLKVRIKEALLVDDRILEVFDFSFKEVDKDTVLADFTVKTIYGDIAINSPLALRR